MPKGAVFCNGKRGERTHVCTTAGVARVERTAKPGALPSEKATPDFARAQSGLLASRRGWTRGSSPGSSPRVTPNTAMPATPHDLFAFLDKLGIAHKTVTHPPLFTVEQSRALRGKIAGGHTKNLFLKDKKGMLVLLCALEDAVIELKSLHRALGANGRFSFGSAELLGATLGVEPGAVTPLAAMNDRALRVNVILEATLMECEIINCHPLVNTMTTSIAAADLVKFLDATGHPPRVVSLAPAAQPAPKWGS